jgi:hypothetical protein
LYHHIAKIEQMPESLFVIMRNSTDGGSRPRDDERLSRKKEAKTEAWLEKMKTNQES